MKVLTNGVLGDEAIDQNADEGRPHIEEIQAVKAMGDDQNVRCEGGTVCARLTEDQNKRAGKSADPGVEKCRREVSEGKIVGDQLCRACKKIP